MPWAERMTRVVPSAVGDLFAHGVMDDVTSFAGGYPDHRLFPTSQLKDLFRSQIDRTSGKALQYGAADGLPALRSALAAIMCRDGTSCGQEDVLVVGGAQQALDLVAKLLLDPGDAIWTENPTFLGAQIAFNPYEPVYEAFDMDSDGLLTDQVEDHLKKGHAPKFFYTVPDFQNPTGITMSRQRREHLLALASEYDFYVIEDSPYRLLNYSGLILPPTLRSLDTDEKVIHVGTLSKVIAPGLRLGWVAAHGRVINKLGLLKLAADSQCSSLSMLVAAEFLSVETFSLHLQNLIKAYGMKRDAMSASLSRLFPSGVTWSLPQGGFYSWVTFPETFDAADFLVTRALPRARVSFVPGASFFPVHAESNTARFSFAEASTQEIELGLHRLSKELNFVL